MTLDKIPGKKIFSQRDVRETPAASATATATVDALTTPTYLTLSLDGDLTNERVLTPGEGIDFTDTGSGGTLTINGENATDSNKGIASFALADFSVSSGAVSLKDDIARTIDGDSGTATASGHNFDILGGEGIDTSASGNDITISAELASTSNKGVASFNSSDFSVSSGVVSLKSKTSYWSCRGCNFMKVDDSTQNNYAYHPDYGYLLAYASIGVVANVNLPHDAVVTSVVVNGNDTGNTWSLLRSTHNATTTSTMATAAVNTTDSSISNATIDNSNYSYWLEVNGLGNTDIIYNAKITYTTDYD